MPNILAYNYAMYVKQETINTIVIEKSKFITYLKPVKSEEEYKEYLKEIKKKHYDATHVCSALSLKDVKRSSDDGEPSGTAGLPMLNVLTKKDIENTCALTVRYFGGIKLGAGGLIRAYSNSVSLALDKATLLIDETYNKYQITLSYELANKVDNFLFNNTLKLEKEYDQKVTINYVLKDDTYNDKIIELTRGIQPTLIGKEIIQKVIK